MSREPEDIPENVSISRESGGPYLLTDPVLINAACTVAELFRRYSGVVRLEPAESTYERHVGGRLREDDPILFYVDAPEEQWQRFSTYLTDRPHGRGKYLRVDDRITIRIGVRHEESVATVVPVDADPLPGHVKVFMPTGDADGESAG